MRLRRGFSLVELLMSFALLGLVIVLLLNLFPSSIAAVRLGEQRYRAQTMASSLLEQKMSVPFSQLLVGTRVTLPVQQFEGVDYQSRLEVDKVTGSDPAVLRSVRVSVEWTVRGMTRREVREVLMHRLPSQL